MHPILRTAAFSLVACVVACSGPQKSAPPRATLLFSPNGEPITGGPLGYRPCAEAMGGWYDRLAAKSGGSVNREAFLADARAQFAKMDLDHDGWITPAELSQVRAPYMPPPEPYREERPSPGNAGGPNGGPGGGPNGGLGGGSRSPTRISSLQEDPVMSADIGPKFKVSQDELLAQSGDVFTRLDKTRKGFLTREDVIASCPAKNAAGQ